MLRHTLSASVIALSLGFIGSASAQTPAIGAVQSVIVYAYGTPAAQARRPLFVQTPVFTQERVETVANGGLALLFADDTQFRVGADSVVTLDRFVYNPNASGGEMALSLTKGSFRFISGKLAKEGVQLRTPVSLIGIRGTDFFVSILASGATLIDVISGILTVASLTGVTATVAAGQGVTVNADGSMVGSTGRSPPGDDALDPGANPAADGLPSRSSESSGSSSSN